MSTALDPLLASCPHCPEWEPIVWSEEQKQVIEEKHNTRLHGGEVTSEAVADLMYVDPKHDRARQVVEEAIRDDAERHNGEVSSNRVRELIPAWVNPRVTSSVYNVLLRKGTLVPNGELRSTDRKGRNGNKRLATYLHTEVVRRDS